jgi:hypothetical protein
VLIALPTIGRDFLTSLAARQWVMNGYTLTLAAFLLIGGRSATGSAGGRSTNRQRLVRPDLGCMRVRPGCGAPDHHPGSAGCRGGLLTPRSLAIRLA